MAVTDFFALLGIDVVLCALAACAIARWRGAPGLGRADAGALALIFLALWWPASAARLPLVGYVRGITGDFSVLSVALSVWVLWACFYGAPAVRRRELAALYAVVGFSALVLYPTALGWGDWDAYRLGWGTPWWVVLVMALSAGLYGAGLRALPGLLALSVVAWTLGMLESTNLWDYLVDPWLSLLALVRTSLAGYGWVANKGRHRGGSVNPRSGTAEF